MLTIHDYGEPREIANRVLNGIRPGTGLKIDNGHSITTYVYTRDQKLREYSSYTYYEPRKKSQQSWDRESLNYHGATIRENRVSYDSFPPFPTEMEFAEAAMFFWPGSYYKLVKIDTHKTLTALLQNHGNYMNCPDNLYVMKINDKPYIAQKHNGTYKPDLLYTKILTYIVHQQRLKECSRCNGKQCYGTIVSKSRNTIVLQFNMEMEAKKIAEKSQYTAQPISIDEARYGLNQWLEKRLQNVLDNVTSEIFCPRQSFATRGFWDAIYEEEGEDE